MPRGFIKLPVKSSQPSHQVFGIASWGIVSSREILSFDGPKPQPQPFPRFPSLVDLREERDLGQPIKPPSLDSFRMKEVDHLTIHTSPSPYVISFHPKYMDLFIPVSGDGGMECTPRVVAVNVHQRVDCYSFVTHRVSKLKDTIKGYSIRGKDGGENPTIEQVRKRAKWDNDDYVCRGLILNGMSDSLFDIYQNVDTSKELWDTLEANIWLRMPQENDKPKSNNVVGPSVVNMVEHNNSSRYNNHKGTRKHHDIRANPNKKPKVTCWKCGKPRHLKKDCKAGNVGNRANRSSTKGSEDGSSNPLKDRCWFKTYESLNDGSILHMGNESTALVHGRGCVDLRLNTVSDNIGSAFMSTSKLNDLILWHDRLGHVHFKRMQDMSKDGLIPAIDMNTEKCKTCMLTKITKKPFQNIKRETKVLELIHSDLCDLHATPSLGNKKYFMAFIDDASRKNRVLKEMVNSMLSYSGLSQGFWGEAMLTACHLLNRATVRQPDPKLKTLGERGNECIFVGYAEHSKAFRFYVIEPNDSVAINSIIELRDAIFDEHRPLGYKWIFKRKMKVDGTVEKFKMDVKTTFLNGDLEKEAPKQWHQKFDEVVLSNGYLLNQADKFLVDLTKEFLSSRFSIKDMREGDVILGIRIKHEINGIAISQSHYIKKVLKKFNYSDFTRVSTPLDTCENLMPNRGLAASQLEYSRVIGYLMYVMTCTRPDNAIHVGKLSRYTSNPKTQHQQAIQRVLKYFKKTMDYRLVYSGYPSMLEGYINASWINNTEDNSSTSGWVFLLGAAGKEAKWLKNLLLEIPLWVKPMTPISIRCDNAATLEKAYSQMYNGKYRHLGVRHSMIRELIINGVVSIEFDVLGTCCTEDEVANFSMVKFFEKMLSRSLDKEEPPMDLFISASRDGGTECTPRVVIVNVHQRVDGYSFVTHRIEPSAGMLHSGLADDSGLGMNYPLE
uniref:Zinc finger, CCHC-type n=1 Tax=Tanacetum cinerariifolium TaxID=118510 RepID=A0A699GKH5_TANCI|nr:zinc finger, CCHC-type [Tanacetum cinerariifolium]